MAISINTPANFASNNVKCTPVSADIIESVSLENPKKKKVYMLVKYDIPVLLYDRLNYYRAGYFLGRARFST